MNKTTVRLCVTVRRVGLSEEPFPVPLSQRTAVTVSACFFGMSAVWICVCASYVLLVTVIITSGFNLSWRHARVFSDPYGQIGSYFGYTVALRTQNSKHWLVAGAPRGNSTYMSHVDIVEPGAVYQCSLDASGKCQRLIVNKQGNMEVVSGKPFSVKHKKDNSWLGGAIAVQNNGSRLVVCAPRWKNPYKSKNNVVNYLLNGICYWTDDTSDPEQEMEVLVPLSNIGKQSVNIKVAATGQTHPVYFFGFGEAGFTAHLSMDGSELVLGAPGVFDWRGTFVRYKDGTFKDSNSRRRRNVIAFQDEFVPVLSSYNSEVSVDSYLGYSLSSGKFYRHDDKHFYVSGAPRAGDYKGKVFVFDFPENEYEDLVYKFHLEGSQMGEYFGAALCVVDLNGDHLDDLVVGAPQYSLHEQSLSHAVGDEGRIYVFINKDRGNLFETTENLKIMGRRKHAARFGTAVANVGDLNLDGYQDIAVGAPFEGNGVVYIYHGSKDGIVLKPKQIISAEEIDTRIKGLGISFSKGVDIDGNHYGDIAVGAFDSGHAVLLRGHPIITFEATLDPNPKRLKLDTPSFSVTACLKYKGSYVPKAVDASVTMLVDVSYGRAHFKLERSNPTSTYPYQVKLHDKNPPECRTFQVEIKHGSGDPTKPIDVVMMYDLVYDPNSPPVRRRRQASPNVPDGFCVECPVVDPTQPRSITSRVPFVTGCKQDICEPDLTTEAEIIGFKDRYILGEQSNLKLKVAVQNKGDPAFQARVTIVLPSVTPLIRIPPSCQKLDQSDSKTVTLRCELGSPLKNGGKKTIEVEVNTQEVPVDQEKLIFSINATSVGTEVNPSDNQKNLILPIVIQSDMTITGKASQDQLVYVTQNKTFKKDLIFEHTYEVWNLGPSRVDSTVIKFCIPFQIDDPQGQFKFMEVSKPDSMLVSTDIPTRIDCDSNNPFDSLVDSKPDSTEFDSEKNSDTDFPIEQDEYSDRKSKRSISSAQESDVIVSTTKPMHSSQSYASSSLNTLPVNRTLFLNCSDTRISSFQVSCYAGPFIANKTRAVIKFRLRANFELLESTLDKKDIILFSSEGNVKIENQPPSVQPQGHRPDNALVHTMFLGKIPEGSVASWIIAVAIICGILILFLIAMALHKMGFFKREKKEELQALKEAEDDAGDVDSGE